MLCFVCFCVLLVSVFVVIPSLQAVITGDIVEIDAEAKDQANSSSSSSSWGRIGLAQLIVRQKEGERSSCTFLARLKMPECLMAAMQQA